jgi:hypothetical protein
MKKIVFSIVLISLFFIPVFQAGAQSLSSTNPTQLSFDTTGFPQWALDLRRWEIVAFGTFPFSMLLVSLATDLLRDNTNELSNVEIGRTIVLAAGISITLAFVDFFIVSSRKNNNHQNIESLPVGSTVTIERRSPEEENQVEDDQLENDQEEPPSADDEPGDEN